MSTSTLFQKAGPKITAALTDGLVIACDSFSWVLCQFQGTIATGYLVMQGTTDEINWLTLYTYDCSTEAQLASNHIVASGIYKVKANGLRSVRLNASIGSGTYTGTPAITLSAGK
jgi:hypothetical protein